MKYALITAVTALLSTSALAGPAEEFCMANGEIAATSVQARDAGIPISETMQVAMVSFPKGELRDLAMTVVAAVYASDWDAYEAFAIVEDICLQGIGEAM